MRKVINLLFITLLFCSCAAVGTKTLYRANKDFQIKKIGFNMLDGDRILAKIFPQTDSIFSLTVSETFNQYGIESPRKLNAEISYANPELTEIVKLCNGNNLDGIILTRLKFIHMTYTMYFVPIAQNYDTEVEMKLFDKNGKILITASHSTLKGNSYMMPPSTDRTIHDGTKGAIKRIIKEIGYKKVKK